MDALRRAPVPCKWPLVGTEVPNTNLLLLAIKNKCENVGKPLNNPLINAPVCIKTIYLSKYLLLAVWKLMEVTNWFTVY